MKTNPEVNIAVQKMFNKIEAADELYGNPTLWPSEVHRKISDYAREVHFHSHVAGVKQFIAEQEESKTD